MTDPILTVKNLQVHFQTEGAPVKAVDDISFTLERGKTLGIVGESGSGKSVTALSVMRLVPSPPGQIVGGEVWFQDTSMSNTEAPVNLLNLPERTMPSYRGARISMIFQEPMSSLNPVFTCGFQLEEALRLHQNCLKADAQQQAIALLQEVKLIPTDEDLKLQLLAEADERTKILTERQLLEQINERKQSFLNRYPHELSGGQIQRVMIAMAISCNPAILIADEPTTALDVTVQARILGLLKELRDKRGMSIIFVTHDLGIIANIADTVAVMYRGKIVEFGPMEQIFDRPQHPYTKGLLACRPQPDKRLQYLPTVSDFMETVLNEQGEGVVQSKVGDRTLEVAEVTEAEQQHRLTVLEGQSPLLEVDHLQVFFPVRGLLGQMKRYVMAVNGVSFKIYPGETLGLVGESGCGKTTVGRALVRLQEPTGGRIQFQGRDISKLQGQALRKIRQDLQIVFQDPFSS
ncbi:MAG: ABC transporter ATP-binding protein, partial [Acaryochloridaceae cyanobacterium RU_4_10]|nr:ABC transporter ATP-binding protein [Acaryochloridaceae cyanobacterium RU_4_10]